MDLTRLSPAARHKLRLELSMRDVLDGLEELVCLDVYRFGSGCFEILGIERPLPETSAVPAQPPFTTPAQLLRFPTVRTPRRRAHGG